MKYTKKQLLKGLYNWEVQNRLQPSSVMDDYDMLFYDAEELAEIKLEALIKFMEQ